MKQINRQMLIILCLLLMAGGCDSNPAFLPSPANQVTGGSITPPHSSKLALTPTIESSPDISFSEDEITTLASLEQVGEIPFYWMRYSGDYRFKEQLGLLTDARLISALPLSWITAAPTSSYRQYNQDPSPSSRLSAPGWGCTVFAVLDSQGDRLLGRNFDWRLHPTLLLYTDPPNGYASVSMVDAFYLGFDGLPLSNQEKRSLLDAPFFPFDGMNEHGLAVGMMAVPHAEGGSDSQKATLGDLQIIRLLLDYARTVDEALGLLDDYNIDFEGGPAIHYLIADQSGAAVVVEFIGGQMRVSRNSQDWMVATNFLIDEEKPVSANSSCWRYNLAFSSLEAAGGKFSPAQAMSLLADVSQGGDFPTIWSVVYNMSTRALQITIRKAYDQPFSFQLKKSP